MNNRHPRTAFQLMINSSAMILIVLLMFVHAASANDNVRQGVPSCRVTTNYDTCGRTKQ